MRRRGAALSGSRSHSSTRTRPTACWRSWSAVPSSGRIRIDIAFEGGVSLAVSVPPATADDLDRALANPDADSFGFEAEDGHYTVSVRKIVFTKRSAREQVVGFGTIDASR